MSGIMVLSAPANFLCSILSGYFTAKKPFTYMYYTTLVSVLLSCYSVLVLIRTFPKDLNEQQLPQNLFHVAGVSLLSDLAYNFWFTQTNAIIMVIADRRIAGIHITMLTSLNNMAQFVHKTYIYKLVDVFGLFIPQAMCMAVSLGICFVMRNSFPNLDLVPYDKWRVSNSVIKANRQPGHKKD
jgi:hypothetical protein